jgi:hypothetical protein
MGESSHGGGRGGIVGGGLGGGIAGNGIGPLSLVAGAKKLFQDVSGDALILTCWQDVLYLMIVQRPTEDQMAAAMERMASLGIAHR